MVDIAGNTFDTALDLDLLTDAPQLLGDEVGVLNGDSSTDLDDYYRFRVAENSFVRVKLNGLTSNAQLYLYGGDSRSELARSVNAANMDELIGLNLKPGIYYFRVYGDGLRTPYQLEASATSLGSTPNDTAGETIETARDLGSLDENGVDVNDFVGNFNGLNIDSRDIYKFELTENSKLDLFLGGLSASAHIILMNSDGSIIEQSLIRRSSTSYYNEYSAEDKRISRNLVSGTYYLEILGNASSTPYQLKASAISLGAIPLDGAGETPETARNLGKLTNAEVNISDFVGNFNGLNTDSRDIYKFELTENSKLDLFLGGLSASAHIILMGSNGGVIEQSLIRRSSTSYYNEYSDEDKRISRSLAPGIYYLEVYGNSSSTSYQLKTSATSLGAIPFDGAGETPETARNLGTLTEAEVNISDFVGNFNGLNTDSKDFYKFELTENSKLDLLLSGLSYSAHIFLLDSNKNLIEQSLIPRPSGTSYYNDYSADDKRISRNLAPGIYYLEVYGNSSSTPYLLRTSATSLGAIPFDGAGETQETARDLGTLTGTGVSINDFIGSFNGLSQDQLDFYKFDLTENSQVNITLTDLNGDANLMLTSGDSRFAHFQGGSSD
jgi:hypothetical protein